MVDANLLVTYEPAHVGSAKEEVDKLLKAVKQSCKYLKSEVDGLFKLRAKNARKIVKELNKLCRKKPDMFLKTYHWSPIDKWTKATINDMQREIKKFVKLIKKNEKWRMELNKRHFDKMHSTELILKLTEVVDRPKVDLENPQKIIKVEIIGNKAGLSLLKADEFLNTTNIKSAIPKK